MVLIVTAIPSGSEERPEQAYSPLNLSTQKPSALIYGHMVSLQNIDMVKLTCNLHYHDAMDVRVTPDLITSLQKEFLIKTPSQAIAELLEMGNLFLLWGDQADKIGVVASDQIVEGVKEIARKQNPKAKIVPVAPKAGLDLLIYHGYQRTIREHSALEKIQDRLLELLASQKEGSKMLLQLPLATTTDTIHTIAYLASLYQYCLLIRPGITPAVEHTQYLLLDGYRAPKETPRLLVRYPISGQLICAIQVHNEQLLPHLLEIYRRALNYLSAGFFTGTTTLTMRVDQDQYNQEWLSTIRGDPEQVLKSAKARSKAVRDSLSQKWRQQLAIDLRME